MYVGDAVEIRLDSEHCGRALITPSKGDLQPLETHHDCDGNR